MRSALRSLRWLAAPAIWAAYFLTIYASESLVCTRGGGPQAHVVLVTLTAAAAFVAILRVAAVDTGSRHHARFTDSVSLGLAKLSLIAIAWTALASAMLPACG